MRRNYNNSDLIIQSSLIAATSLIAVEDQSTQVNQANILKIAQFLSVVFQYGLISIEPSIMLQNRDEDFSEDGAQGVGGQSDSFSSPNSREEGLFEMLHECILPWLDRKIGSFLEKRFFNHEQSIYAPLWFNNVYFIPEVVAEYNAIKLSQYELPKEKAKQFLVKLYGLSKLVDWFAKHQTDVLDIKNNQSSWVSKRLFSSYFNFFSDRYKAVISKADFEKVKNEIESIIREVTQDYVFYNNYLGDYPAGFKRAIGLDLVKESTIRAHINLCNPNNRDMDIAHKRGNCLFNAIAEELCKIKNEDSHVINGKTVRAEMISYLRNLDQEHPLAELMSASVTHTVTHPTREAPGYRDESAVTDSFHGYVNIKEKDRAWGDELDLRAISNLYCFKISLFNKADKTTKEYLPPTPSLGTIHLDYDPSILHYTASQLKNTSPVQFYTLDSDPARYIDADSLIESNQQYGFWWCSCKNMIDERCEEDNSVKAVLPNVYCRG